MGGVRNQAKVDNLQVRRDLKKPIEALNLFLSQPQRQPIKRLIPGSFPSASDSSLDHSDPGAHQPLDAQPLKRQPEQHPRAIVLHCPLKKPIIEQLQVRAIRPSPATMTDHSRHSISPRPLRHDHPAAVLNSTQLGGHKLDQLTRGIHRPRNEAEHPKRSQHQGNVYGTIAESTCEPSVRVREPKEPIQLVVGEHLRKRVKRRPLPRRE